MATSAKEKFTAAVNVIRTLPKDGKSFKKMIHNAFRPQMQGIQINVFNARFVAHNYSWETWIHLGAWPLALPLLPCQP